MKKDVIKLIVIALIVLPIFASCRKELCYNHFSALQLNTAWEQEWERDYGMAHRDNWDSEHYGMEYHTLRPETPEWIALVRYKPGSQATEQYLEAEGGQVMVDAKPNESFLLYNGDTEYIVLSDIASFTDARATATPRSRSTITYMMERHPDVRSMNPPDVLYSAFIETLPEVETHQVKPLAVKMQPVVFTYVVRYEIEYGREYIALVRGALGGMAESVYLRDGRTSDEAAILLYDCELKPYGCEAVVHSFGVPGFPDEYYGRGEDDEEGARAERPYTLNLEALCINGKTVEFNFDISDQIARQPKGGVITVSGIRIEDEMGGVESGFDVDVSNWGNHEDIDLPVGVQ